MVSILYFFSDSGQKCRKRKLKLRLFYSCISIIGLVRRRKLIDAHYFQKAQTLHETQTQRDNRQIRLNNSSNNNNVDLPLLAFDKTQFTLVLDSICSTATDVMLSDSFFNT